jgi:quercetin dioxygenase-like cupin family protein
MLRKLAFALVAVSWMSQGSATEAPEKLTVLGSEITVKTDGARTGGAMAVVETAVPPGYGPPKHVHAKEDEMFYILEGQFRLWRGDETLEAGPGTVAFLPRNVPHTYQNVGSSPGRLLVTITPAGFEGFFREVSKRGLSAPKDMDEINAVADEYGLKFVGPPPPAVK